MSIRLRLVLGVVILAFIASSGAAIIVKKLYNLKKNQEIFTFKDHILHKNQEALELILSAQSLLYQHQAGYSRDIDSIVNNILRFQQLLIDVRGSYKGIIEPEFCNSCHRDVASSVDNLEERIDRIFVKLTEYQEHISVFITSSDHRSRVKRHGQASAVGESIIESIVAIKMPAELMVKDLLSKNEEIVSTSMVAIQGSMGFIFFIAMAVMMYTLYSIHSLMESLLKGTEHIRRDDFSLRLPADDRKDEFGLLASRFNLMAAHLQDRDIEIHDKAVQLEEANTELRDLNENLEVKIKERTNDLENMVLQLRETTSALEESKRRLETANADLVKANLAKSNFLSIVSHELKTPLSVINGFLSLILDERYQSDSANLREAVEISKRRGQQLSRMIDELIDLSRLDAQSMVLRKEPVDVEKALLDVAEQFEEQVRRKQIRLVTSGCSCATLVFCDPDKLKQIFTNLLSNAIKFSPEGSDISIDCRELDDSFLFSCRDHGIGIPPEEKERIFDKFYQVDSSATRRYGGAGLGLSIVKELVQLHGGRIWVESEPSKWCSFNFTIPKNDNAEPSSEGEISSPLPHSGAP